MRKLLAVSAISAAALHIPMEALTDDSHFAWPGVIPHPGATEQAEVVIDQGPEEMDLVYRDGPVSDQVYALGADGSFKDAVEEHYFPDSEEDHSIGLITDHAQDALFDHHANVRIVAQTLQPVIDELDSDFGPYEAFAQKLVRADNALANRDRLITELQQSNTVPEGIQIVADPEPVPAPMTGEYVIAFGDTAAAAGYDDPEVYLTDILNGKVVPPVENENTTTGVNWVKALATGVNVQVRSEHYAIPGTGEYGQPTPVCVTHVRQRYVAIDSGMNLRVPKGLPVAGAVSLLVAAEAATRDARRRRRERIEFDKQLPWREGGLTRSAVAALSCATAAALLVGVPAIEATQPPDRVPETCESLQSFTTTHDPY